jgi:hypothetical protein
VAVVVLRGTVQAHAHADPVAPESGQHRLVEQYPVGLQADPQPAPTRYRFLHGGDDREQPVQPGEQRLPAMEDQSHLGQLVCADMLGDPAGGCPVHLGRHDGWAVPPTLVRHRVDVAVVTGEVAPLVHLQDELAERRRPPALRFQRGEVQLLVRPFIGVVHCG